jgi:hypothetical protein
VIICGHTRLLAAREDRAQAGPISRSRDACCFFSARESAPIFLRIVASAKCNSARRLASALEFKNAVRGRLGRVKIMPQLALERHVTDREDAGLRGRVKICCTERDYVYPDHHWVMYTDDTFSPQGHLLERRHRNPEGSRWSIICRYDEQWRILEKEHIGEKADTQQLFSYRYDPLGRLDRIMLRSGQEGERVFESVQYAADGTTTKRPTRPHLMTTRERLLAYVLSSCYICRSMPSS